MPFSTSPVGHVRIMRCDHGTNYVTLGPVTLHLTDPELVLLDRTIHKLAQRQPALQRALLEGLCFNNALDAAEAGPPDVSAYRQAGDGDSGGDSAVGLP